MKHEIRVIFGDTDAMGIVYYANYLRYFESARAAYWRHLGNTADDLDRLGIALPVVEAHCRYRTPARYEDLLTVEIEVAQMGPASIRFQYSVHRANEVCADGYTRHACVNKRGVPVPWPKTFVEAVSPGPLE